MRAGWLAGLTASAVASMCVAIILVWRRISELERSLAQEQEARAHIETVRHAERTGRIAAEKRVAALLLQMPEVCVVRVYVQLWFYVRMLKEVECHQCKTRGAAALKILVRDV